MNLSIRPERLQDHAAIGQINRLAFGGETEARLVEQLRAEGYVRVSLVAEIDDRVVGHILFSDLPIAGSAGTVLGAALAPLAVGPEWQRQGIGSRLTEAGLQACRAAGCQVVVVLGHASYYPRFGFWILGKAGRAARSALLGRVVHGARARAGSAQRRARQSRVRAALCAVVVLQRVSFASTAAMFTQPPGKAGGYFAACLPAKPGAISALVCRRANPAASLAVPVQPIRLASTRR
jgi:putative acetyltransferase